MILRLKECTNNDLILRLKLCPGTQHHSEDFQDEDDGFVFSYMDHVLKTINDLRCSNYTNQQIINTLGLTESQLQKFLAFKLVPVDLQPIKVVHGQEDEEDEEAEEVDAVEEWEEDEEGSATASTTCSSIKSSNPSWLNTFPWW
ncbi:unnamed protein product [Lactuca virosa]|uniref:Uncharacterized protein n=1 Tax=Lactuca virosa TaxID=75947 RepID=A0AAU9NVQ7_9ASTR|nr:unnamed protein product [Lactuca virosa]